VIDLVVGGDNVKTVAVMRISESGTADPCVTIPKRADPMGRVIVGTIVGAVLGGILGWLPNYGGATFNLALETQGKTVTQTVSLAHVLSCISILVGIASGGIIGAIAGATSANPNSKPAPFWVWIVLGICIVSVLLFLAYLVMARSGRVHRPTQSIPPDGPAEQRNLPAQDPPGPNK
jgi:hypothetical protein